MIPPTVKKLLSKPIGSLPLTPLRRVEVGATAFAALTQLKEGRSGLLGIQGEKSALVGVLTERDILTKVFVSPVAPQAIQVASVMTAGCKTIKHNASIARAIHTMASEKIRHLVVESPEGYKSLSTLDLIKVVYSSITKGLTTHAEPSQERSHVMSLMESSVQSLSPAAPLFIDSADSIRAAVHIMNEKRAGSILVKNKQGGLVGIFTERDLLTRVMLTDCDPYTTSISAVMTQNPQTVLNSASVSHAFNVMHEGGYRHIPIVDFTESLVGVLSVRNFMQVTTEKILEDLEET